MIIVILIFFIIVTGIPFGISMKNNNEEGAAIAAAFCIGAMVVLSIFGVILTDDVIDGKYIDEKIEMYQEENTKIEEQIDTLVQCYMKYESDTLSEFKSEDSMTLVSLYPELKSDELVQAQISVYAENNKKIKELKEQKIDVAKSKWWLYFGK